MSEARAIGQHTTKAVDPVIDYLMTPKAIRERCGQIYSLAQRDELKHFRLHADRLPECADFVISTIKELYPTLEIPFHSRWRHFAVGGIDRTSALSRLLPTNDEDERSRVFFDLAIISVLLDAGAGPEWSYTEPGTSRVYTRSEGLAVASFHMFKDGLFSQTQKFEVSGDRLQAMTLNELADGMQVSKKNPLVGLEGRLALLQMLGTAISNHPEYFGSPGRLGRFFDFVSTKTSRGSIGAKSVLESVLQALGPIWPGRIILDGHNLGDVWRHSQVTGEGKSNGLIPFHKLSQWLSYSLLEPLMWSGKKISGIDDLTGLPEYRNGGLFLDSGVIALRDEKNAKIAHQPGAELIVEWRALTVCLLDKIAESVRRKLGKPKAQFPLVRVLEGGTWNAGRAIARQKRSDGSPPLSIISDGTVF